MIFGDVFQNTNTIIVLILISCKVISGSLAAFAAVCGLQRRTAHSTTLSWWRHMHANSMCFCVCLGRHDLASVMRAFGCGGSILLCVDTCQPTYQADLGSSPAALSAMWDSYPRPTRMRFSCVALRSVTMRPCIYVDASWRNAPERMKNAYPWGGPYSVLGWYRYRPADTDADPLWCSGGIRDNV